VPSHFNWSIQAFRRNLSPSFAVTVLYRVIIQRAEVLFHHHVKPHKLELCTTYYGPFTPPDLCGVYDMIKE